MTGQSTVVVPYHNAETEGDGASYLPFGSKISFPIRAQQISRADQFPPSSEPVTINGMKFRRDASNATNRDPFTYIFHDIKLWMVATPINQGGSNFSSPKASTTFVDNYGNNTPVVVLDTLKSNTPLNFSSTSPTGSSSPMPFEATIMFDTPFTYNPSVGTNLLWEVVINYDAARDTFTPSDQIYLDEASEKLVSPRVVSLKNSTAPTGELFSGQLVVQYIILSNSAGFVTAGGWFDSPAGKAHFTSVIKYKKGASTPTGQTQFRVGDLKLRSDSYDWLVINNQDGARAQFSGVGSVNEEENYSFMIWATDGKLDGDPDKFEIVIKNSTKEVIYDSKEQEISGGNIVVHKGKKNKEKNKHLRK